MRLNGRKNKTCAFGFYFDGKVASVRRYPFRASAVASEASQPMGKALARFPLVSGAGLVHGSGFHRRKIGRESRFCAFKCLAINLDLYFFSLFVSPISTRMASEEPLTQTFTVR